MAFLEVLEHGATLMSETIFTEKNYGKKVKILTFEGEA